MNLNIEELARKADLSSMTADAHCREDYWTATRAELEAFARLIVERCAQEAEALADKLLFVHDNEGASIALEARGNIRQLLEY